MADVERTCANCGNVQASGDFCEKCGTRMPAAPAQPAPGGMASEVTAAAYQAPRAPAPPQAPPQAPPPPPGVQPGYAPQSGYAPGYGAQPGYGAPPAGQYGYSGAEEPPRRASSGWGRMFDLSFKGFITPSTLKATYVIVLGLIILYVVFNIILVAMAGNRFTVIAFFISLFVALLWFFVTRVLYELVATVMRMRNKSE